MPDAYRMLAELETRFTKRSEVRWDILTVAHGLSKEVQLTTIDADGAHCTRRDVDTMRALAQSLLEACEFVETSNPRWFMARLRAEEEGSDEA